MSRNAATRAKARQRPRRVAFFPLRYKAAQRTAAAVTHRHNQGRSLVASWPETNSYFTGDPMAVQPYLFFEGRCEEALNFYKTAVGAEISMLMRYKESPDPQSCPPGAAEKVMHASLRIGDGVVMASDGRCDGQPSFKGFALSLPARNPAEAEKFFNALADGGRVEMPLTKTFFAESFGMLADRFGVMWMVMVEPAPSP
jgi:PhnB protein